MQVDESLSVPHLSSDAPDRRRARVPREDLVRAAWKRLGLARGARPAVGALLVGGVVVALAAEVGAPELALGGLVAYAAYRMLRYGIDLKEALTETVQLEQAIERR